MYSGVYLAKLKSGHYCVCLCFVKTLLDWHIYSAYIADS